VSENFFSRKWIFIQWPPDLFVEALVVELDDAVDGVAEHGLQLANLLLESIR
jgi:hypothetical protein